MAAARIEKEQVILALMRIPKKIRTRKLKKKLKGTPELKFSNTTDTIRAAFLKAAAKPDIDIFCIAVRKNSIPKALRENPQVLYNYFAKQLLEEAFSSLDKSRKLLVCIDRCMSASQTKAFEQYIQTEFYATFREIPEVRIVHEDSKCSPALQVVDFICGAFGYKYNVKKLGEGCEKFTGIIRNKVRIEKGIDKK
jgi:hypothetical protein